MIDHFLQPPQVGCEIRFLERIRVPGATGAGLAAVFP
jgi:hypothetical protein